MHNTHMTFASQQPIANRSVESRLSCLLMENEREASRRRLFRNVLEEEEMLLMRRPVSQEKAYALFGMLLGTLPPAAIFYRYFGGELTSPYFQLDWFLLLLAMNAMCCFFGRRMGARVSRWLEDKDNASRTWKFFMSSAAGISWGVMTGAMGGLPAFGIGAIFGVVCAVPVGMLAFPMFTLLHRLLARGGMIDARHLWPLACGVVMVITALILGL